MAPDGISGGITNDISALGPTDIDWSLLSKVSPMIGDSFAGPERSARRRRVESGA
ncbi:hypothetical protein [Amycolatopsis sp. YIM 10]|uniref:hypothetical protein n=1 Tax=Amycolatopsis sp. YIM 10 TaxID=2653857 RepID=UPI0012902D8B|nr:hypothetical protein [Amycolatopsis sp. YIM 10]